MRILRGVNGQRIFLFVAAAVPVVLFIGITIHDVKRTVELEDPQCMDGGHKCGYNSSICIHHSQWCDGKVDCPSGDDEEQRICHDGGSLSSDLAACLNNNKYPGRNISTALKVHRFEHCMEGRCNCKKFPTISCRKKELIEVPMYLPNTTYNLILSMNNFTEIKSGKFEDLKFLQSLKLDRNYIKTLETGSFKNLNYLERLVLHTNLVEEIVPDVFQCRKLKYLDLSWNKIKFIHAKSFDGLPALGCLMLENNLLGSRGALSLFLPPKCSYLDLSYNQFRIIRKETFSSCAGIKTLLMEKNSIVEIENTAFQACIQLTDLVLSENNITSLPHQLQEIQNNSTIEHLDVANNPMTTISQETFENLPNLLSLNLSGVPVSNLNKKSFLPMRNFYSIEFSSFEMCRYAPSVLMCRPKTDGISTIYNLLDVSILGIFVWIIAMVTCFGNLLVMICRTAFREEKNIHSLFIKNLAASDFMLGIYLLIIGSHDQMYRHHYNRFALDWMEGWTCDATGFVGIMSIEVSVFILTCMSIECCLTVCFPLQPRILTVGRALLMLLVIWFSGAVIAGLPIVFASKFGQFYSSNGVCFPLYIHDPYLNGWQYSTVIFNFVNVIGMIIIIASYTIIFYNMRRTRSRIPIVLVSVSPSGIAADDQLMRKMKNVDKRLFVIVLTNILCWIPISIIKIMALYNFKFPSLSHAWLTIFIIPINSALNPIIYSITTPSFRRKFKSSCNIGRIQEAMRTCVSNLRTFFRGRSRPRNMSKTSAGTAMSLLGLQDILLIQRYRISSLSSQNRHEESFIGDTNRLNTANVEYKHLRKKKPSRVRAFSLTTADVLLTVPKVGWSMIPRRNSLGPGLGYSFRELYMRSKLI